MNSKINRREALITIFETGAASLAYLFNPLSVNDALAFFHAPDTKKTTIDGLVEVTYPKSLPENIEKAMLSEVKKVNDTLVELLGTEKKRYSINVGDYERAYTDGSYRQADIPLGYVQKESFGAIWHEVTHLLTGKAGDFFSEGLAEYIRHTFSRKQDMHAYVKRQGFHKSHPVSAMVNYRPTDAPAGSERNAQYSVADSFVKFLIEDVLGGDIKRFMAFYNSWQTGSDYEKHFGKTFGQLAKEWEIRIENYFKKSAEDQTAYRKPDSAQTRILEPEKELYLHHPEQKPLHIGDAIGKINDIDPKYLTGNPPTHYTWAFEVHQMPSQAQLDISAYSITTEFKECKADVFFNEKYITSLNELPGAGEGSMLTATLPIDTKHLQIGENTLKIASRLCYGNSYDDFLIHSLKVMAK